MDSIANRPGSPIDVDQVIAALPAGVRMNLGWRDAVADAQGGMLMGRIGSARVLRKLIIKLNALDLYDIEIGRMNRKSFEWIVEGQVDNVYADQLGEVALSLHGKVAG